VRRAAKTGEHKKNVQKSAKLTVVTLLRLNSCSLSWNYAEDVTAMLSVHHVMAIESRKFGKLLYILEIMAFFTKYRAVISS